MGAMVGSGAKLAAVLAAHAREDVQIQMFLEKEQTYYLCKPYAYLVKNFLRYALLFTFLSLLCAVLPIMLLGAIPWTVLSFLNFILLQTVWRC